MVRILLRHVPIGSTDNSLECVNLSVCGILTITFTDVGYGRKRSASVPISLFRTYNGKLEELKINSAANVGS